MFSLSALGVPGGRTQCSSVELKRSTCVDFNRSKTEPYFPVFLLELGLLFQTEGMFD